MAFSHYVQSFLLGEDLIKLGVPMRMDLPPASADDYFVTGHGFLGGAEAILL